MINYVTSSLIKIQVSPNAETWILIKEALTILMFMREIPDKLVPIQNIILVIHNTIY